MHPRTLRTALVAALFCAPVAASAQATLDLDRPVTAGVQLPATSVASDANALSLAFNPAALSFGASGLGYVHEEPFYAGQASRRTDGLFLSLAGRKAGEPLSAGLAFSIEWVRGFTGVCPPIGCSRRTSLGAAFGTEALSLGFTYRWFQSDENPDITNLGTVDVGLLFRPAKWLSFGLLSQTLNEPSFGATTLPRRWVAGLGIRPVEPLQLWVDAFAPSDVWFDALQLTYGGRWTIVPGLDLVAQVAQRISGPGGDVAFVAGVRGGFGPASATIVGDGALGTGGSPGGGIFALETYAGNGPSFGAPRTAYTLDLEKALAGPGTFAALFGRPGPTPWEKLVLRVRALEEDPTAGALVLEIPSLDDVSFGKAEELRTLLTELRARGVKVLAYLKGGGDLEYYLATAADRIYATPEVMLTINGLSSERIYLRGLLDKLGVEPEFVKIGAYKSAPEQYTRTNASEASAEQTNAILDDEDARYVNAIAQARKLDPAKVRELLAKGLWTSGQAVTAGLLDGTAMKGPGLDNALVELAGTRLPRTPLETLEQIPDRWGPVARIAIVEVVGTIAEGGGGSVGADVAGAERIVKAIEAAAKDDAVGAIVLRIDSPGGEVAASERIFQAANEARKEKPVVASMADVAASGGYYVAVGADYIVAEPSTVTGSIGVFAGKADLSRLLGMIGVSTETFRRGPHADFFTLTRPWTDEERRTVEGIVDDFYETFLQRVAAGRKMSRDEVHAVAQGRVWTGAQARERRLVDSLGGLTEALAEARRRAGLPPDAPVAVSGAEGLLAFPDVPAPPRALAPWMALWQAVTAANGGNGAVAGLAGGAAGTLPLQALPGGPVLWQALVEGKPMALAVDLPTVR